MKYFVVAALMAASSSVNAYLARPVADDFLWISEQSGLSKVGVKGERMPFDATALQIGETLNGQAAAKDLRIVSITNTNGYKSPGIFLRHNWDLIQDCLNNHSDEDAWVDAAATGYKERPMAYVYGTSLV